MSSSNYQNSNKYFRSCIQIPECLWFSSTHVPQLLDDLVRASRVLHWPREVRVYRGTGVSRGVRPTTWERSLKNWELHIPCFVGFFCGGNALGLVPASLPHALGYTCTFCAPTSPSPITIPWRSCACAHSRVRDHGESCTSVHSHGKLPCMPCRLWCTYSKIDTLKPLAKSSALFHSYLKNSEKMCTYLLIKTLATQHVVRNGHKSGMLIHFLWNPFLRVQHLTHSLPTCRFEHLTVQVYGNTLREPLLRSRRGESIMLIGFSRLPLLIVANGTVKWRAHDCD